jgi:hypothetical protein
MNWHPAGRLHRSHLGRVLHFAPMSLRVHGTPPGNASFIRVGNLTHLPTLISANCRLRCNREGNNLLTLASIGCMRTQDITCWVEAIGGDN